jgi:hypothetical protein
MNWNFTVEASKAIIETGRYGNNVKVTLEDVDATELIKAIGNEETVLEVIPEDVLLKYMDNFETKDVIAAIGIDVILDVIGKEEAIKYFGQD